MVDGNAMTSDGDRISERLRAVFAESLHIDVPSADTDLFLAGLLDSLQLVELLFQIEQYFELRITLDDIDLEDLRTLERIARVVAARMNGSERATGQQPIFSAGA
ncbi:MAG: hypothetical protein A3I01_16240 [Betaproteobacteria bacterium RIFCSPLOWO2_02_FULL_65_24]|nr:MAG: hypothetical protein A3I01_16240 [Betaproteobacteria bacterium RIFCSPLOWO2_02_FULL_65_24]OGA32926.1 MAG: hypothetical protein A3G80_15830 [Betaproteobacteria bacterium RIFCSPLOWO2_12_FULL_62_13b]